VPLTRQLAAAAMMIPATKKKPRRAGVEREEDPKDPTGKNRWWRRSSFRAYVWHRPLHPPTGMSAYLTSPHRPELADRGRELRKSRFLSRPFSEYFSWRSIRGPVCAGAGDHNRESRGTFRRPSPIRTLQKTSVEGPVVSLMMPPGPAAVAPGTSPDCWGSRARRFGRLP